MRIIQSANPRPLNLLAVGPGGLVAAASSTFGALGGVEVWDATNGERKGTYAPDAWGFRSVAFVLNDTHLFAADRFGECLLTLPGANGELTEVKRTPWLETALVAVGDRVFVAHVGHTGAALTCWSVPKAHLLWKHERWDHGTQFGASLALDVTGDRLALSIRKGDTHPIQFVAIRNANTGESRIQIPTDAASAVQQLAFTADGTKLLIRTDSRTVQTFDATTGAPAGELVHPGRPYVTGIAVHPRGPVACARTNGTVTLWDAEKREQLRTLDWKIGKLVSVAFSPDGSLGAAGTEDGKVIVWDVDL